MLRNTLGGVGIHCGEVTPPTVARTNLYLTRRGRMANAPIHPFVRSAGGGNGSTAESDEHQPKDLFLLKRAVESCH